MWERTKSSVEGARERSIGTDTTYYLYDARGNPVRWGQHVHGG